MHGVQAKAPQSSGIDIGLCVLLPMRVSLRVGAWQVSRDASDVLRIEHSQSIHAVMFLKLYGPRYAGNAALDGLDWLYAAL